MDIAIENMKVKDLISNKALTLSASLTISQAIEKFEKYGVNMAPVVDEHNSIIGTLSESDCMSYITQCLFYDSPCDLYISEFMNKKLATVSSDWDLFKLELFLKSRGLDRALVVNSKDNYIGTITTMDLLTIFNKNIKIKLAQDNLRPIKDHNDLREKVKLIMHKLKFLGPKP